VKLLLDENLSPALIHALRHRYPDTVHVRDLGLKSAPDPVVWTVAANHGYTIVTKNADFHHRSFVEGHPRQFHEHRIRALVTLGVHVCWQGTLEAGAVTTCSNSPGQDG
jgi:predicted nuclease of predicted toxin-antitoxin system